MVHQHLLLNPARALEYQGLMQEVTERKLSYLAQLEQPEVDAYILGLDRPIFMTTQASKPIYFFKNAIPEKMVSAHPTPYLFLGGVISLTFPSLIASMAFD